MIWHRHKWSDWSMSERNKNLAWATAIPTIAMLLAVFAWSFINWRLPPAISDWDPFAHAAVLFGWALGAGYTLLMRNIR